LRPARRTAASPRPPAGRRRRWDDRARSLEPAERRAWLFRLGDSRTARHWHDRAGRRLDGAGLPLRGLRDSRRARHHILWRLAGLLEELELVPDHAGPAGLDDEPF